MRRLYPSLTTGHVRANDQCRETGPDLGAGRANTGQQLLPRELEARRRAGVGEDPRRDHLVRRSEHAKMVDPRARAAVNGVFLWEPSCAACSAQPAARVSKTIEKPVRLALDTNCS